MNRVVIVGASAGGLATAEALRRLGYAGAITLIGDEPHLPYDRPPLSKQCLAGEWGLDRLLLREPRELDALDLDMRLGSPATELDPVARSVTMAGGTQVGYDRLVIATGVRPRRLPGTYDLTGVHTLRTIDDVTTLRAVLQPGRRLVVVGAGFLGAEIASMATGLGVSVTMLESAPLPLAHAVGAEVGQFLARCHRERGVDVRTGVAVAAVTDTRGRATGVTLTDGTTLPADDVLVAIGSVPNSEWLAGSGLTVTDGVVCDEYSAAAPDVYAVGDVARWYNPLFGTAMRIEHRTNAAEAGLAVAHNLVHPDQRRTFAPTPYFWSDQYGMKIQAYGYLRDHDEAVVVDGDLTASRFLVAYRRADRLTGVLAVGISPKTLRTWRALIRDATAWDQVVAESPCGTGDVEAAQLRLVR